MDRENFVQFKEFANSGGELPQRELGELQNIMAMIPIILDLEKPDPKLKEKLAKTLIGMQDEIKSKIKEEKKTKVTATPERTSVKDQKTKTFVERPRPTPTPPEVKTRSTLFTGEEEFQLDETKETEIPEGRISEETAHKTFTTYKRGSEENGKSKENVSLTGIWIVLGFIILLLFILSYFVYDMRNSQGEQLAALNNQVADLEDRISSSEKFVNEYLPLAEFFNFRDIEVINLIPAGDDVKAQGKLLISFEEREGLIQLGEMPVITADQSFQLWMESKGKSYSLGVFLPQQQSKFIRIPNVPYIPKQDVDLFRVTVEPRSGSEIPTGDTYLYGSMLEKTRNSRRR
jgi:hypothetical protein